MESQQTLAFGAAEGNYRDERHLIWRAAKAAGGDSFGRDLLLFLHEFNRPMQISIEELGDRLLWCSTTKARSTLRWAVRHQLVSVRLWQPDDGPIRANSYAIDLEGVRRAIHRAPFDGIGEDPSPREPSPREPSPGEPSPGEPSPGEPSPGEPSPPALIPGGETPRTQAGAGAPDTSFVLTSSLDKNLTTYVRTNECALDVRAQVPAADDVVALCRETAAMLFGARHPDAGPLRPAVVSTIRRLATLALTFYGREWLLQAVRDAQKRRPGDVAWLKGVAANQTADRDLFFRRFDGLRHACRSPP